MAGWVHVPVPVSVVAREVEYGDGIEVTKWFGDVYRTYTTTLDLYASRGIADSSPDFGGGTAIIYSF